MRRIYIRKLLQCIWMVRKHHRSLRCWLQCCFRDLWFYIALCHSRICFLELGSLFVRNFDQDYLRGSHAYRSDIYQWAVRKRADLLGIYVWQLLLTIRLLVSLLRS